MKSTRQHVDNLTTINIDTMQHVFVCADPFHVQHISASSVKIFIHSCFPSMFTCMPVLHCDGGYPSVGSSQWSASANERNHNIYIYHKIVFLEVVTILLNVS